MNNRGFRLACLVVFVCYFFSTASLHAQQSIAEGTIEAAGSVGLSGGIGSVDRFTNVGGLITDLTNVSGGPVFFNSGSVTKWNFGVSGGYTVKSNLMIVGEFVRTRLAKPTITFNIASVPTPVEFIGSLLEATGGVQYQVPLPDSKIAPFVGASMGLAHSKLAAQESSFNILDLDVSENHFTFNFGGGARVYMSPSWGIRPEIKLVHIPDETFVRTSVGVFYQFGK